MHASLLLSLPLPPNGLKSSSDSWVALRIRGQGRCLTPCQTRQNLSCQRQRRNFWIALYQFHLEMIKQGVKNDNYTSLISLQRHWYLDGMGIKIKLFSYNNKANLKDLLAATGLVILLKLDSNYWFFSPCDLEIWWMTLKHNRAPLLYYRYIKFCASFQIHQQSQTWVTVRKRPIRVKIGNFLSRVTFKVDGWPWKTIGNIFYITLSSVHHFKAIGEFKLEFHSGNV